MRDGSAAIRMTAAKMKIGNARRSIEPSIRRYNLRAMTIRTLGLLLAASVAGFAQNGTSAGRFTVEHPTLLNLGFEWEIAGDANRNAAVAVEYRAAGESAWRTALPLVRIGGERVFRQREG